MTYTIFSHHIIHINHINHTKSVYVKRILERVSQGSCPLLGHEMVKIFWVDEKRKERKMSDEKEMLDQQERVQGSAVGIRELLPESTMITKSPAK